MRFHLCLPRALQALAVAALVALPLPAQADSGREERLTIARAYIEASIADVDIAAMVRTMYKPLLEQIRASGQDVSEAQEAEIEALYQENMAEPLVEIMRAQDEIMADLFTLTQIEDLYAFYMTPSGRAVMQKLPQLTEAQMPMINELVMGRMEVMLPKIMEILQLPE